MKLGVISARTFRSPGRAIITATITAVSLLILGGVFLWVQSLASGAAVVLVGAGDIADCHSAGDEATAKLVEGIPGTVFTIGDNAYDAGTASEFASCYDPSWGRLKARTHPVPGNHDYDTKSASGYFAYFGALAGDSSRGYYSYDLGAWHIVALNSNCAAIRGCQPGSDEEQWLRADLAAHPNTCLLAYWHHPLYSSGSENGSTPYVRPLWQALYDHGADVVVNGHDHDYERFAPQDALGTFDPEHGIREFVVGTGGKSLRSFGKILPNSQVHDNSAYGVIKFTLHPASYDWEFIPVAGKTFSDAGQGVCHRSSPASTDAQQAATAQGATPVAPRGTPVPYPTEVLADHPISYWQLGEASGPIVADSGGGANPGMIQGGITPALRGALAGSTNTAMSFDGTSGYIRVPDNANLNPTGELTLEAWARPAVLDGDGRAILHKGGTSGNSVWQYRLSITSGNQWRGTVYIGDASYTVTDPGTPSPERWDYLVLTRSGETLTLYVNGQPVAETKASGAVNTSKGVLAIGRTGNAATDYFRGMIDEVAVYDKALSAYRILAHYYAGTRDSLGR